MSIVPDRISELLDFCTSHAKVWSGSPASAGLTPAQAAAFEAATEAAVNAVGNAFDANEAKKAAYVLQRTAVSDLRASASATIALIKAFADNSADPSAVYAAAQIPEPATPSPAPAPGRPTDFIAQLTETGVVMLKWKCSNPVGTSGTLYEVRRSIGGAAAVFVGASGTKSFDDDTLPAGSVGVQYEVTAVRSTRRGLPGLFNVNFGVGSGGGAFIASTSEETAGVKIAA